MARNGAGTYERAVADYVYNTTIDQDTVNQEMDDIASALTGSLAKNGETVPTANLPMGTYRHTGVGNGSARTDYAALGQVQDGKANWADGGGTADAITATYSPVITALVDGQLCFVRATAANATTTPTFSPNSLTARTIVKNGGVALAAGDIVGDGHELELRYDLTNTRWELLNPNVALSGYQPLDAQLTTLAGITAQQAADLAALSTFMGTVLNDADAPTVLGTLGAAASGAVTGTGITQTTGKILGRTTASTGAIEEITVGTGLTLSAGSLSASGGITSGTAQATTSGTSIDFTSIPAGTKRVTVMFSQISTNGSTAPMIQIGDSGGVETTGYVGSISFPGASSLFSAGFALHTASFASSYIISGSVVLTLLDSATNTWAVNGDSGRSDSAASGSVGGVKTLTGALDRIRLTNTNGTDAFDAGSVNILYE